jgi:hypothetical protein
MIVIPDESGCGSLNEHTGRRRYKLWLPKAPGRELLNNGDAKRTNGEFSPFSRLRPENGARGGKAETHDPRAVGRSSRFSVN